MVLTAAVWTATVGFDSRGLNRDCRLHSRGLDRDCGLDSRGLDRDCRPDSCGLGRDCRLDSRDLDRDCLLCLELFGKGENVYFEQESNEALLCD